MRRNGQAVTLYYKTWPNVDVVPVSRVDNAQGEVSHYNVPDMNSETWIKSQPARHSREMTARNESFGVELKRIVKMIKWWNHQHSGYLQSYHVEVLALNALTGSFTNYPWELYTFFNTAVDLVGSSLFHHISEVDSYLDWRSRQEVLKRLETAKEKSLSAWYKTTGDNNDHEGAIRIWRQVFGDEFPPYG